jgi:plastocyanin
MTIRTARCSLVLVATLAAAPVLANHEGPDAHAKHDTKTIVLDGNDVRPARTTMGHGDIVTFVNYSTHPARVTFSDPELVKKIRCSLVRGREADAPAAPWALFTWEDGKLVGNVPPGQFASVCSFEPGIYAFTTMLIGTGDRSGSASGQIVVQ